MVSVGLLSSLAGNSVLHLNSSVDRENPACLKSLVTFPSHPIMNIS